MSNPPVTRSDWCDHVRKDWESLKWRLVEEILFLLNQEVIKPEDCCKRIMNAQHEYGNLEINHLHCPEEFRQEILDAINYVAASDLQDAPQGI